MQYVEWIGCYKMSVQYQARQNWSRFSSVRITEVGGRGSNGKNLVLQISTNKCRYFDLGSFAFPIKCIDY